jgi:hypothetical protein
MAKLSSTHSRLASARQDEHIMLKDSRISRDHKRRALSLDIRRRCRQRAEEMCEMLIPWRGENRKLLPAWCAVLFVYHSTMPCTGAHHGRRMLRVGAGDKMHLGNILPDLHTLQSAPTSSSASQQLASLSALSENSFPRSGAWKY